MGGLSYVEAGVDIAKGDAFVEEIKKISRSKGIGLFGAIFDVAKLGMKDPMLVSGTDGVGTKLKLAFRLDKHDTIGIDLVAMCVNDVLCHGAKPIYFLDYIGTSKLDIEIGKQIIAGIVRGCELSLCELVGGETAEMPGIYTGKEYDLAGFCVGAVERDMLLPKLKQVKNGDVVIGLPSSGVHSNGFSLVNHILEKTGEKSREMLEELLIPTKIYVPEVLNLLHKVKDKIHALAHITGGGIYENIMRVVPDGMHLNIDFKALNLKTPRIFDWIAKSGGVSEEEMRKVFNLGVGFAVIAESESASEILSLCSGSYVIGKIGTD